MHNNMIFLILIKKHLARFLLKLELVLIHKTKMVPPGMKGLGIV